MPNYPSTFLRLLAFGIALIVAHDAVAWPGVLRHRSRGERVQVQNGPEVTHACDRTPSIENQREQLFRQIDLYHSGDYAARLVVAESFLNFTPIGRQRFHLELLDLREPTASGCGMGAMAVADVAAGRLNILAAGDSFIPPEKEAKMWQYIQEKYGIWYMPFFQGGTEPKQFHNLLDEYNRVVRAAIEKRYPNADIWDEARRHVDGEPTPTTGDKAAGPGSSRQTFSTGATAVQESNPATAGDDSRQLQGRWICTGSTEDGKDTSPAVAVYAVFTDKEVKICGLSGSALGYRLIPGHSPKRCDLAVLPQEVGVTIHAIYELHAGTLRLCVPMKPSRADYPDNFKPGAGRLTYVFRRATDADLAREIPKLTKEEAEVLKAVRAEVAQDIALLEAKKYRDYLERSTLPDELQDWKATGRFDESLKYLDDSKGPDCARFLRLVAQQTASVGPTKTHAMFDLRAVHANGMPGKGFVHYVKIGSRWYLDFDDKHRH